MTEPSYAIFDRRARDYLTEPLTEAEARAVLGNDHPAHLSVRRVKDVADPSTLRDRADALNAAADILEGLAPGDVTCQKCTPIAHEAFAAAWHATH